MSQENVGSFIEAIEAFNRLGRSPVDLAAADRLVAFYDPEVRFEPQQSALQGGYVGREGVLQWLADLAEHYRGGRVQLAETWDLGERVLALGTLHFTAMRSGIETEAPIALVASFRNGLITQFKDYGDKDEALEAVGLRE
jgi:ketosteroid isomerase-like protein